MPLPVIVVDIVAVTVVERFDQLDWKTAGVRRSCSSATSFAVALPASRSSMTATVSGITCETSAVIDPRVPAVAKRIVKCSSSAPVTVTPPAEMTDDIALRAVEICPAVAAAGIAAVVLAPNVSV